MSLDERLELDITEALRGIDSIEDALGSAASSFKVALADALDVLGNVTVGDVDASSVTTAIDSAVAAADAQPVIDADAGDITSEIDAAVGAADATVAVDADTAEITGEIEGAVAGAEAVVTPGADASEAVAQIESDLAGAEVTVSVDADTSGAEAAVADLGDAASASSGGVDSLSTATTGLSAAAGAATGDVGALASGAGALGPEGAAAAGAVAALGGAVSEFFTAALASDTATVRFNRSLGDMAGTVSRVDVSGLNTDLADLAEQTGNDDEALLHASARIFDLGVSAGVARPEVAATTQQIDLLAIRATTLNPTLGEAGEVAEKMTTAFARGGRALAPFGISLSAAEINARALADTGKSTAAELTIYEKAAAGAAITTERLGDSLGSDIQTGAQSAEVQFRSLQQQFHNAIEELGAPLIAPVLDLLEASLPVGVEFATVLSHLATAVIPVLTSALEGLTGPLEAVNSLMDLQTAAFGEIESIAPGLGDTLTDSFTNFLNPVNLVGDAVDRFGDLTDELTGSTSKSEEEIKAQEAAIRSLTSALEAAAGPIDQTLLGFTEQQAKSEEVVGTIAKLGLTYDQLAGFARHGKAGVTEFDAALDSNVNKSKVSGDELDKLRGFVDSLGTEFQKSAKATLEDATAKGTVTKEAIDAAAAHHLLASGGRDWVGILGELLPAQAAATTGTDAQATAAKALEQALRDVLAAEEDQIQKELSLASAALGAESAGRNVEKAQRDLAAAIRDHGAASQEAIDAEFRLRQAQQSQVESLVRLAGQQRDTTVAQLENAGTTVDAGVKSQIYKEQLLALAGTVEEPMRSQIVGLANDIRSIPESSNTTINADAAAAWDTINQTEIKLEHLTEARLLEISVQVFGAEHAQSVLNQLKADTGNLNAAINVGTPKGSMAGGPLAAGEASFVGEVEPEIFVPRRAGVIGNQAQLQAAISGEVADALNRLGDRFVAGGGSVGPIIVNEVAQDPEATANAVAFRLGEGARR